MAHDADTPASDMAALEAFVIDNDDLLTLEERIGRFNIFDALDITRTEIRHSNFLAWLLRPGASHGQGDLFLKAVLMDVLRHARANGFPPPVSPVQLDGTDLHSCEVRREWRHIDLLVVSPSPAFVVAVENKIDSGEHSNQLERYREVIAREFPDTPALFVFLTLDGIDATEDDWLPYSYGDLHRVLTRVRRTSGGSLGSEVGVFIDQYLNLIGSHMTDDITLRTMCQTIYANHRRAIDLIIEQAEVGSSGLLRPVAEAIESEPGGPWEFFNRTGRWLRFAPKEWLDLLPPIGTAIKNKRALLVFEIYSENSSIRASIAACPCADPKARTALIERLTRDPKEFGLAVRSKTGPTSQWTRLVSCNAYKWHESEGIDEEAATAKTLDAFRRFRDRAAGVTQAIKEVFPQTEPQ